MFTLCEFGKVGILSKHGFDSAYFVKIWKSMDIKTSTKVRSKNQKAIRLKGAPQN